MQLSDTDRLTNLKTIKCNYTGTLARPPVIIVFRLLKIRLMEESIFETVLKKPDRRRFTP